MNCHFVSSSKLTTTVLLATILGIVAVGCASQTPADESDTADSELSSCVPVGKSCGWEYCDSNPYSETKKCCDDAYANWQGYCRARKSVGERCDRPHSDDNPKGVNQCKEGLRCLWNGHDDACSNRKAQGEACSSDSDCESPRKCDRASNGKGYCRVWKVESTGSSGGSSGSSSGGSSGGSGGSGGGSSGSSGGGASDGPGAFSCRFSCVPYTSSSPYESCVVADSAAAAAASVSTPSNCTVSSCTGVASCGCYCSRGYHCSGRMVMPAAIARRRSHVRLARRTRTARREACTTVTPSCQRGAVCVVTRTTMLRS